MEKKSLNNWAQKAVKGMIRRDMDEWPPGCFALSYQPVRPMKNAPDVSQSHNHFKKKKTRKT